MATPQELQAAQQRLIELRAAKTRLQELRSKTSLGQQPTTSAPERNFRILPALRDVGKGAVKGLGSTLAGASELGEKILSAPLRLFGADTGKPLATKIKESGVLTPTNTAQKIGFGAEQILELAVPTGAATAGAKIASGVGRLGKAAPLAGRAIGEGVEQAGKALVQTGGDVGEAAKAGIAGAAFVPAAEAVGAALRGAANVAGKTAKFAGAQFSGLNPETIDTIISSPKAIKEASDAGFGRIDLGNRVKSALDSEIANLSETGKAYQQIRKAGNVKVPEGFIQKTLSKYGLGLDDAGKIITTAESTPLSRGDLNAIEDFIGQYGKQKNLSGNAFLNTRKALDIEIPYGSDKTSQVRKIFQDLRVNYDSIGKKQLAGLAEADAKYAPQVRELKALKKDYLNPDGTLKDGAINKIANLTGKGKDKVLTRIKKVIPDIDKQINIVKALEDIERTGGEKVGTYARGAIFGGIPFGIPGAVVSAFLAQPTVFVPLLRKYGQAAGYAKPQIEKTLQRIQEGKKVLPIDKAIVLGVFRMLAQQDTQDQPQQDQQFQDITIP